MLETEVREDTSSTRVKPGPKITGIPSVLFTCPDCGRITRDAVNVLLRRCPYCETQWDGKDGIDSLRPLYPRFGGDPLSWDLFVFLRSLGLEEEVSRRACATILEGLELALTYNDHLKAAAVWERARE